MLKIYNLKPEFKLGFIDQDRWEVEHESSYVGLLSVGHNKRFAHFHTNGIVLEAVLNTAEVASDSPYMLDTIKKVSEFLENNEKIQDKIPQGILNDLKKITEKYYELKK